ncbi:MAG: microcystin-dependent protein [Saprospiraceae bacterium]|jgi:microcystin-dependent protein
MDPFLGEIILFAGNFAPRGWALCEGQLIPINQNQALFSLFGTIYGGNGRTTFALPDLRGRAPVSSGTGPGLSPRPEGQKTGSTTNNITIQQMPAHNHNVTIPTNSGPGTESEGAIAANPIYAEESNAAYSGLTESDTGNNQPVNNMQPFLALNYIVALVGVFPSRN